MLAGLKKLQGKTAEDFAEGKQKIKTDETGRLKLPLSQITPDPEQPRKYFDDADMLALIESVKIDGVLTPISVRAIGENQYMINAGERRYRAAKEAGLDHISVTIDDNYDYANKIAENVNRAGFTQYELVCAIIEAVDVHGIKQAELVKKIGLGKSYISELYAFNHADEELKELYKNQLIDIKSCHKLNKLLAEDEEAYRKIIDEILNADSQITQKEIFKLIEDSKIKIIAEIIIDDADIPLSGESNAEIEAVFGSDNEEEEPSVQGSNDAEIEAVFGSDNEEEESSVQGSNDAEIEAVFGSDNEEEEPSVQEQVVQVIINRKLALSRNYDAVYVEFETGSFEEVALSDMKNDILNDNVTSFRQDQAIVAFHFLVNEE